MYKILQIIVLTVLVSNVCLAQKLEENLKYFDTNYSPITKEAFFEMSYNHKLLRMEGDSTHHRELVKRIGQGRLQNRRQLDSLLTIASGKKIDGSKPIVIIYYPGEDPCNSSGTAGRRTKKKYYDKVEKDLNAIKETQVLYVYNDDSGLRGRNDAFRQWIKDPNMILEKLFFTRHYPCSSFVVISEKNIFLSYFGESGTGIVTNALKTVLKEQ